LISREKGKALAKKENPLATQGKREKSSVTFEALPWATDTAPTHERNKTISQMGEALAALSPPNLRPFLGSLF